MKALRFHYDMPRIVATRMAGQVWHGAYVSPLAPTRLESVPEPELPRDDWVRVRTRLAGICGSDVGQVMLKGAYDNALIPLLSFPHVLGHEAVGIIEAVGAGARQRQIGERVVVNPWLSCVPRGIDPLCPACQNGDLALCRNFTAGDLPPSLHLGNNSRAPGVFSPLFACHASQCFPLPDDVSDEVAVLADPFSVCLHAVLRYPPPADGPALVYGQGVLGLLTVAVLRRLFPQVAVYAVARHPHQVQLAKTLGAQQVLVGRPETLIQRVAELTGAKPIVPQRGKPWLLDGAGIVYDTIGSAESVETALRLLRTRGQEVVIGVGVPKRFEWTPLYFKELQVVGSNAFGAEPYGGQQRHAMDIYLELAQQGLDLSALITHRFPLEQWQEAFTCCMQRRTSGAVKVVFEFG